MKTPMNGPYRATKTIAAHIYFAIEEIGVNPLIGATMEEMAAMVSIHLGYQVTTKEIRTALRPMRTRYNELDEGCSN